MALKIGVGFFCSGDVDVFVCGDVNVFINLDVGGVHVGPGFPLSFQLLSRSSLHCVGQPMEQSVRQVWRHFTEESQI